MNRSLLIVCLTSVLASSALVSCSSIPPEAYFERGSPESLLDVSSEVVNLSVASESALDEMTNWINQDQPSRAELYCMDGDARCVAAQEVLDLYGVPSMYVPSADNMVSLVYERVLARDCENRFIDNTINPYHLNHPTFGCSTAANMVQMVSDKQQFVRPNLMDMPDAKKSVQTYKNYMIRKEPRQNEGLKDSLLEQAEIN